MKKIYAYMMLLVFTGFMAGIAVDFSLYLKFINAGCEVENMTILPEECQEESGSSSSDGEFQVHQVPEELLELSFFYFSEETSLDQISTNLENGFYEIPYSPPERL
ncbi:hypothetical protein [Halocola ammonii]